MERLGRRTDVDFSAVDSSAAASAGAQREQLAAKLEAALSHLRAVRAFYWDRDWRREHRGSGRYPEHYLWEAVHGYLDLYDAADSRTGSTATASELP